MTLMSATVAGGVLSGCGLSSGSTVPLAVRPGSIKPVPQLRGVPLTVGSKEFTEQLILAYIAEFALVAAGAKVQDMSNITGSNSARNALAREQIDIQWEYTGASWISYNGKSQPIPDAIEQFEAVRKLDRERNGIAWIALAVKADNTYAFAMNQRNAKRLGVSKISDLQRLAREKPEELTFCVESEFANRNDGLPGVSQAYGFSVDRSRLSKLATGSIYEATAAGETCNFGEVYATDGRVKGLNLKLIEDDKNFFPRYNPGITLRVETLRRYPQLREVFTPISQQLSNAVLVRLNGQVDIDGHDPAEVARDWMISEGFVTAPSA